MERNSDQPPSGSGGLVSSTLLRNRFRWQTQTQKLSAEVGSRLVEVDSGEAKLTGRCDVVDGVINEDCPADIQVAPTNEQLEDLGVGLDHPNVAREDQFIKGFKEGK